MTTSTLEPTVVSPIEYPHLREVYGGTLRDLAEGFDPDQTTVPLESGDSVRIDPNGDSIMIGEHEVPYTDEALEVVLQWVDLPKSLMKKVSPELYRRWINEALSEHRKPGQARIGERNGLISVLDPRQIPFDPAMIVDVASRVLGENAPISDVERTASAFNLDVVTTPDQFHDLGDPRIGDISKAGLRFGMNTRQNLAPVVQPYYFRLWCTNGCSSRHDEIKLDARGGTMESIMVELESNARLAFSMVEREVAAMYELRNEPVTNPERTINRMARDNGLSARTRERLMESLPAIVDDANSMTMFDLVQAATHLANSPEITTRGARTDLENLGGSIVTDHVERCQSCHNRLS